MNTERKYEELFLARRLADENLRHNLNLRRFTGVITLNRQTYELALGWDQLRALDLTPHSALYASLLISNKMIPSPEENCVAPAANEPPVAVMLATPVPPVAWNRGFRLCCTTHPDRGQTHSLIQQFREMHLYVRHIDSGPSIRLEDFNIVGARLKTYPLSDPASNGKDAVENKRQRSAIRPTTVLSVEIPVLDSINQWAGEVGIGEDERKHRVSIYKIHELLNSYLKAWQSKPDYRQTLTNKGVLVEKIAEAFEGTASEDVRIEWVSPLLALGSLGGAIERIDNATWREMAEYLPMEQSNLPSGGLSVSLARWKKLLDPSARESIERAIAPGLSNLAAVITTDREERTLTAEFVALRHYAVVQFELIFPSGYVGHLWREWIFDEIQTAGGGILRTFSMGRIEGRWGKEVVIAWFPFSEQAYQQCISKSVHSAGQTNVTAGLGDKHTESPPSREAIKNILDCVRALQGFTSSTDSDRLRTCIPNVGDSARKRLVDNLSTQWRQTSIELLDAEEDAPAEFLAKSYDSTLRNVKVWYRWPTYTSLKHREQFQNNPFNFTRPLTYKDYERLFDLKTLDEHKSRFRLANRITQRLLDPRDGSVILIGAHRSGKTSVMNIVLDLVNDEIPSPHAGDTQNDKTVLRGAVETDSNIVGIRLNAAVTPAHLLVPAIIRELERLEKERDKSMREKAKTLANAIKNAVGRKLADFSELSTITEWSLGFALDNDYLPKFKVKVKGGNEQTDSGKKVSKKKRKTSIRTENEASEATQATELMALVDQRERGKFWDASEGQAALLRLSIQLLRDAIADVAQTLGDKEWTLVVAVDEISESAAWGAGQAFPVWRHLIESENFRNVRWLFSSTRPPTAALEYSPLSNALREYTMRPLYWSEAFQLIDNFDETKKRWRKACAENAEPESSDKLSPVVTYGAREYMVWVTGRFPYLLQVLCVHIFEEAVGYHIPIISTALVRKIMKEKVVIALSDYFESQWGSLPDECRLVLLDALAAIENPLGSLGFEPPIYPIHMSPSVAQAIQRAGIGWAEDKNQVAPLFIYWLSVTHPIKV